MDDSFAFFKFRKNNDINNTTINDNKNNNKIIMTTQEGQFEANRMAKNKKTCAVANYSGVGEVTRGTGALVAVPRRLENNLGRISVDTSVDFI